MSLISNLSLRWKALFTKNSSNQSNSSISEYRLRWKGTITGPHSSQRINELLRKGEISLLHSIEYEGSWITVREYLRSSAHYRAPVHSPMEENGTLGAHTTSAQFAFETTATHTRKNRANQEAGETLERAVREGYLWCGSTFLMPLVFSLVAYAWQNIAPDTDPISVFILLAFTTLTGSFLPLYFVRKIGDTLNREGLSEIRQTQIQLTIFLAILSSILWLWCFWILIHQHP